MLSKKTSITLLACAVVLLWAIGWFLPPIFQPQAYHNFADQRSIQNIPNFWNVFSNIPFALAGIWGLYLLFSPDKIKFKNNRECWLWMAFSVGLILTAVGSSYYHLSPDNDRLVWDRLSISIVFMSLVAALIGERYYLYLGLWLWPVLILVGFLSVFFWKTSEVQGTSDLRFYLGLQAFTFLTIIVMLLTTSPYTLNWVLAVTFLFYALAVFFERADEQIYLLTNKIVSGHTLKHLSAAFASAWLIWMIWQRKIVNK